MAGGGFGRNFRGMVGWIPVRIDVGGWSLVYLGPAMEVEFQHWSYFGFSLLFEVRGREGETVLPESGDRTIPPSIVQVQVHASRVLRVDAGLLSTKSQLLV